MKKILIIQTAFIGDVILATSLVETIHSVFPNKYLVDIVVRKGNEVLLKDNPTINELLVWDKKKSKYKNLWALSKQIKKAKYDEVYNLQRFASTGFLTWRSKAKLKTGYKKNPFSFTFTNKVKHTIGDGTHEVERNVELLNACHKGKSIKALKPKLFLPPAVKNKLAKLVMKTPNFVVLAPASVWFTKQLPPHKWVELINQLANDFSVYLIGAPADRSFIETIITDSKAKNCYNTAGDLSLIESAALIAMATRTYVNDSAPLHIASAVNAPVTAFFCSTVPSFGFGPLSDDSIIKQVEKPLSCRPCGLHGFKKCPKNHFDCGNKIELPTI